MVTLYFNTHSIVQIVVGFSAQACDIHQVFRRAEWGGAFGVLFGLERIISLVCFIYL